MPSLHKIKTPVVARIGLTIAVLGALFGESTT